MTHTPGPWAIDEHAQIIAMPTLNHPTVLGRVYCGDIYPNDDLPECTANARLIAAAPKLLESLEQAVTTMKAMGSDVVNIKEVIAHFEKTIAEAK